MLLAIGEKVFSVACGLRPVARSPRWNGIFGLQARGGSWPPPSRQRVVPVGCSVILGYGVQNGPNLHAGLERDLEELKRRIADWLPVGTRTIILSR